MDIKLVENPRGKHHTHILALFYCRVKGPFHRPCHHCHYVKMSSSSIITSYYLLPTCGMVILKFFSLVFISMLKYHALYATTGYSSAG